MLAAFGLSEFRQFKARVAVWRPHHCDVDLNAVEPDNAVNPMSLDLRLPLQLQTQFGKEAIAAGRSSTTTPTWSIRRSVVTLRSR